MNHAITPHTVRRLVSARKAQVEENIKHRKECVFFPLDHPRCRTEWAHVEFVNGKTFRGALNLRRFAQWVRLAGAASVPVEFVRRAEMVAGVHVSNGIGGAIFYLASAISCPATRHSASAALLGAPLRLVAPPSGGEFVFRACNLQDTPTQTAIAAAP